LSESSVSSESSESSVSLLSLVLQLVQQLLPALEMVSSFFGSKSGTSSLSSDFKSEISSSSSDCLEFVVSNSNFTLLNPNFVSKSTNGFSFFLRISEKNKSNGFLSDVSDFSS